jgi:hypothetical protein
MPKIVPKDVEMTKPGSKMRYKVTYPNGNEKWMREKPGHKSEKWKEREKKMMLKRHPEIIDFFKKLEVVLNKWIVSEAEDKDIEQVVREFETTAGWNKARMVTRRLKRSERVKADKAEEGEQKKYYEKLLEGLQIAVIFANRRSRDKREKKSYLADRMMRIAQKIYRLSRSRGNN